MEYQALLDLALDFATAIMLGALIGIEREKRKAEEGKSAASRVCAPSPCSRYSARRRADLYPDHVLSLDPGGGARHCRRLRGGGLCCRRAVRSAVHRTDHRDRSTCRLPPRRTDHAGLSRTRHRPCRRRRRDACLQAAAARDGGKDRLGRHVRRPAFRQSPHSLSCLCCRVTPSTRGAPSSRIRCGCW